MLKLFNSPPSPAFASLAVFLSASLWGLYWVPLRFLEAQGIAGGWAIVLLNLPAALFLAIVVLKQWQRHKTSLYPALIIGVFTGLGIALYTSGLIYTSVVRATLLFYVMPVWATLIGIVWLGETASWQRWSAIAAGLAGLALMVSGGGSMPLNIGDLFAFFSGVAWAIGAALIKRFNQVPLAGMSMFQFIFASVGALLLGAIAGADLNIDPNVLINAALLPTLIAVLIILPSVWVVFWAQKILFPGRVGLLMMSEVMVAVISASLFLPEEHMSPLEWCGAVLIIGACLLEVLNNQE